MIMYVSLESTPKFTSDIPYSKKVWRVGNLANFANHLQFAKLKPSKVVV